eukprot:NODE_662_length_2000_cov_25.822655_g612_i0.p1 GENE.NODE_662_length_2000_cov_25.822655_g612_i0~~NODE_662_length_2000_cov_25.822655_g612_i0.p1  ORF type:complete len:575 (+),score=75.26 NODE_662_length_2000_cov_25.822655_g612_i0:51-1727(+)
MSNPAPTPNPVSDRSSNHSRVHCPVTSPTPRAPSGTGSTPPPRSGSDSADVDDSSKALEKPSLSQAVATGSAAAAAAAAAALVVAAAVADSQQKRVQAGFVSSCTAGTTVAVAVFIAVVVRSRSQHDFWIVREFDSGVSAPKLVEQCIPVPDNSGSVSAGIVEGGGSVDNHCEVAGKSAEPVAVSSEAFAQSAQPVVGTTEPIDGMTEPVAKLAKLSVEPSQADAMLTEEVSGCIEPLAYSGEAVVDSAEPVATVHDAVEGSGTPLAVSARLSASFERFTKTTESDVALSPPHKVCPLGADSMPSSCKIDLQLGSKSCPAAQHAGVQAASKLCIPKRQVFKPGPPRTSVVDECARPLDGQSHTITARSSQPKQEMAGGRCSSTTKASAGPSTSPLPTKPVGMDRRESPAQAKLIKKRRLSAMQTSAGFKPTGAMEGTANRPIHAVNVFKDNDSKIGQLHASPSPSNVDTPGFATSASSTVNSPLRVFIRKSVLRDCSPAHSSGSGAVKKRRFSVLHAFNMIAAAEREIRKQPDPTASSTISRCYRRQQLLHPMTNVNL